MKLKLIVTGFVAAYMQCAHGELFSGVEFPTGSTSFADAVVMYEPSFSGGTIPTGKWLDSKQALGIPNYTGGGDGNGAVSLGDGGRLTLQFIDNALIGSNDNSPDLYIFEVGPSVEDMFVEISKDGIHFNAVGKVFGSISSVDIDSFGFTMSDRFYYVRLTDVFAGSGTESPIGADIDAVGAISSEPQTATCSTGTVSQELAIHIPSLEYQTLTGNQNIWANFEFYEQNINGELFWKLKDFGLNQ
jgi:hypothetical protein